MVFLIHTKRTCFGAITVTYIRTLSGRFTICSVTHSTSLATCFVQEITHTHTHKQKNKQTHLAKSKFSYCALYNKWGTPHYMHKTCSKLHCQLADRKAAHSAVFSLRPLLDCAPQNERQKWLHGEKTRFTLCSTESSALKRTPFNN